MNPMSEDPTRRFMKNAEKGALATGLMCKDTKNPACKPSLKQRTNGATLKIPAGLVVDSLRGPDRTFMLTIVYHKTTGKVKIGTRHDIEDLGKKNLVEMMMIYNDTFMGRQVKIPTRY